jgi:sensor histidine kinase YesM
VNRRILRIFFRHSIPLLLAVILLGVGAMAITSRFVMRENFLNAQSELEQIQSYYELILNEMDYLKVQKEAIEYRALQMQINPHFLFNILESINWKAVRLLDGPNDISRITLLVSKILKYAMDMRASIDVPLAEELTHARYYLEIQKYGFSESEAILKIRIMIQKDERYLKLAIKDNGSGNSEYAELRNGYSHGSVPKSYRNIECQKTFTSAVWIQRFAGNSQPNEFRYRDHYHNPDR